MSIRENKQVTFLVVLLVILGLTLFLAPRINRQPTASVVPAEAPGAEQAPAAVNDARIRLDLIEKSAEQRDAGRENLFQYRASQPPAPVVRPGASPASPFAAPPQPASNVPPPVSSGPPVPPPPPPIPLKYQGFARNDAGGPLTAFLVDDVNHFNVKTGEVLMGRYRIVSVTDTSVEVEDLQYNRRQNLPLLK